MRYIIGDIGNTTTKISILNKEYKIVSVISSNSYTITSAIAANASDTGNGGANLPVRNPNASMSLLGGMP